MGETEGEERLKIAALISSVEFTAVDVKTVPRNHIIINEDLKRE